MIQKYLGILLMLLGLFINLHNVFFRDINIASSAAVMQLDRSDTAYAIGYYLATQNTAATESTIALTLTVVGIILLAFSKKS